MRRTGVAAPLRIKDELPDTEHITRLLAADLTALRILLDELSEHVLLLRPDYRWTDTES